MFLFLFQRCHFVVANTCIGTHPVDWNVDPVKDNMEVRFPSEKIITALTIQPNFPADSKFAVSYSRSCADYHHVQEEGVTKVFNVLLVGSILCKVDTDWRTNFIKMNSAVWFLLFRSLHPSATTLFSLICLKNLFVLHAYASLLSMLISVTSLMWKSK